MKRTIELKIVIDDDSGKMGTLESLRGFSTKKISDSMLIIGILENLKQKHLSNLKNLAKGSCDAFGNFKIERPIDEFKVEEIRTEDSRTEESGKEDSGKND